MNIVIFKDLTTDEYIENLESEAKKYTDLWVDMNDENERRFVKEQASIIAGAIKVIERGRIDKKKAFGVGVELEAKRITERLKKANIPFTKLIDDFTEARAVVLAKKKEIQDAKDLAIQIEGDHESAITLDKMRTFEIEDAKRQQIERNEKIASEARKQAEIDAEIARVCAEESEKQLILSEAKAKRDAEKAEKDRIEAKERADKQAKINSERAEKEKAAAAEQATRDEVERQKKEKEKIESEKAKLEADKEHVSKTLRAAKVSLMNICDLNEEKAKEIVLMIAKKEINNVSINYFK